MPPKSCLSWVGSFIGNRRKLTCDALRDLVPFVKFKKREKHPWRSLSFSKVTGF